MGEIIYDIEYKGQTYHSKEGFELLSQEEFDKIKADWYTKPTKEAVNDEILRMKYGGDSIADITKYYFRELMDNTQKYSDKWCINDAFEYLPLLSVFVDKLKKHPKVFITKKNEAFKDSLDTVFRLGGIGLASKVGQFPQKTCDYVLYEYNVNNNWYDYSCGWGSRLTGALKRGINYYGTDPNFKLMEKLKEYTADFKAINDQGGSVNLYCQGSEHFIPEMEGKIGLAFSSPPYFLLEDYKVGDQSYKTGETSYQDWLDKYMQPTFNNIFKYLVDDGYFICNIKDFKGYTLEADTVKCAEKAGFELYKTDSLKQANRYTSNGNSEELIEIDSSENIFVFIKKGATPHKCHPEKVDLW